MTEQFELRNDPESPVRKPPPPSVQGRQTLLFSGMDCLLGQFSTTTIGEFSCL